MWCPVTVPSLFFSGLGEHPARPRRWPLAEARLLAHQDRSGEPSFTRMPFSINNRFHLFHLFHLFQVVSSHDVMCEDQERLWLRACAEGDFWVSWESESNLSWLSSQASDKLHAVQPKFNVGILAQCAI